MHGGQSVFDSPAGEQAETGAQENQQETSENGGQPLNGNHTFERRLCIGAGDHSQPDAGEQSASAEDDADGALPEPAQGESGPQDDQHPVEDAHCRRRTVRRRKSASVTIPSSTPSSSTTGKQPYLFSRRMEAA